jgi:hypothetical protein
LIEELALDTDAQIEVAERGVRRASAIIVSAALVDADELAIAALAVGIDGPVGNTCEITFAFLAAERDLADAFRDAVGDGQTLHTPVDATKAIATVVVAAAIRIGDENAVATEPARPGRANLERHADNVWIHKVATRAELTVEITDARALTGWLTNVGAALLASPTIAIEATGDAGYGVFEEV